MATIVTLPSKRFGFQITPLLQPDWLPLLRQAVGVVTKQGGITSHLGGDRGEIFPGDAETHSDLATHLPSHHLASHLNLSQTSSLSIAKSLPVEGIDLLRSELMMLEALDAIVAGDRS